MATEQMCVSSGQSRNELNGRGVFALAQGPYHEVGKQEHGAWGKAWSIEIGKPQQNGLPPQPQDGKPKENCTVCHDVHHHCTVRKGVAGEYHPLSDIVRSSF